MVIKQVVSADISKDSFSVCIGTINQSQDTKILGTKSSFTNSLSGFKQLLEWVSKKKMDELPCWFVMEATGVYYENLAFFLKEKGYQVSVLLPNKARNFAKSLNLKSKTDDIDAKALCLMGLQTSLQEWNIASLGIRNLKQLCREYFSLQKKLTRTKNQIHALEHSAAPLRSTLKRLKQQVKMMEKQQQDIEEEIAELVKNDAVMNKKVGNICTIKGIKLLTAAFIIAETNGFAVVENTKQLASYAGLDVVQNQSGKFVGKTHISKKGNKFILYALYMPALSNARPGMPYYPFYKNIKEEKKKSGMVAIVAISRKLLILIYTLWKNDTIFNPEYSVKSKAA